MRSELFETDRRERQTTDRWVLQSKRMLRVSLGPDVLATKGAMVAYQGQIEFHHQGAGGLGKFVRKALSSEDNPTMRVSGQGEVFIAHAASEVFLIVLEGDGISINGPSLLAYDATLESDVHRTQGAGMFMGGGMFNVLVQGTGTVALATEGEPMLLDCSQQPTFVDPQAAVCWSANLTPNAVSSMNVGSLLRGGSGEAMQYSFHGPGFVVVQPSEGPTVPPHTH